MNPPQRKLLLSFPLCFLAFGNSEKDRMRAIASWCAFDVGRTLATQMRAEERRQAVHGFANPMPTGFDKNNAEHVALLLGMEKTKISGGNVPSILAEVSELDGYLNAMTATHSRHPYAKIWHELFWEVVQGTGMSYREMSVLAAIVSCIGTTRKKYIARSVITQRALGYKSAAMMAQEIQFRTDGALPLTQSQLKTVTDKLHERKFFARARKDPWHTYYSMNLDQGELEQSLLGGVEYKSKFHSDRKQRDREFMAAAKAARGANVNTDNVNTENSVHGAFAECSPDVHGAFTLGVFTSQNSNSLTKLSDTKLQDRTISTLAASVPQSSAGEGQGKAFNEMSKEAEDDDQPSGWKKANGEFMTRKEAREFTARHKAEAGLE